MPSIRQLQNYLLDNIPISKALGVEVESASTEQIILTAPFSKNVNHKETIFGGSLHAVSALACWSFLYQNLYTFAQPTEIVISRSEVDYLHAVTTDFKVICSQPTSDKWYKFMHALQRKGKARIQLKAQIFQDEKEAVDFLGWFVVISK